MLYMHNTAAWLDACRTLGCDALRLAEKCRKVICWTLYNTVDQDWTGMGLHNMQQQAGKPMETDRCEYTVSRIL